MLVILKKYDALNTEEKNLKKSVKAMDAELQLKTKKTIESLSATQSLDLLSKKWIAPMVAEIAELPLHIVDALAAKLDALATKYQTTFEDVETEIGEVETSLVSMIDDLRGNDFDMQGLKELKKLLGGE